MNLLSQVGRMYPQAVYFPIRTLYLTLKIEQRERCKFTPTTVSTLAEFQIRASFDGKVELFVFTSPQQHIVLACSNICKK